MEPRPGRVSRWIKALTDEKGWAKALGVFLGLAVGLGAVGALVWPTIRGFTDGGPGVADIKVNVERLPDGSEFGGNTNFLLPYGAALPAPRGGTYCSDSQKELARRGKVIGAAFKISLQNAYQGSKPSEVQVTEIRAEVVSSRVPESGVVVACINSGGDVPVTANLRADEGATARDKGTVNDQLGTRWRLSDPLPGGSPVSFVLSGGEQQQINLTVRPGDQDRDIRVVADMIANGNRFTVPLTAAPVTVLSDAAASPYVVGVKGVLDGPAHYLCVFENDASNPSICPTDRVFSLADERAALARAGTQG